MQRGKSQRWKWFSFVFLRWMKLYVPANIVTTRLLLTTCTTYQSKKVFWDASYGTERVELPGDVGEKTAKLTKNYFLHFMKDHFDFYISLKYILAVKMIFVIKLSLLILFIPYLINFVLIFKLYWNNFAVDFCSVLIVYSECTPVGRYII